MSCWSLKQSCSPTIALQILYTLFSLNRHGLRDPSRLSSSVTRVMWSLNRRFQKTVSHRHGRPTLNLFVAWRSCAAEATTSRVRAPEEGQCLPNAHASSIRSTRVRLSRWDATAVACCSAEVTSARHRALPSTISLSALLASHGSRVHLLWVIWTLGKQPCRLHAPPCAMAESPCAVAGALKDR